MRQILNSTKLLTCRIVIILDNRISLRLQRSVCCLSTPHHRPLIFWGRWGRRHSNISSICFNGWKVFHIAATQEENNQQCGCNRTKQQHMLMLQWQSLEYCRLNGSLFDSATFRGRPDSRTLVHVIYVESISRHVLANLSFEL